VAAEIPEASYLQLLHRYPEAFRQGPPGPWHERQAEQCLAAKDWQGALFHLDRLLARNPKDADPHRRRGAAYALAGRPTDAVEEFSRAIALKPDDAAAWRGRGNAYLCLGRRAEAEADFTKAITFDPKDGAEAAGRGEAYAHLKQYDKSAADFARAAELDPPGERPLACRALVLLAAGDEAGYRKAAAAVIRLNSEPTPIDWWACALGPTNPDNLPVVLAAAEKNDKQSPNNPDHLASLGALLYREGRLDAAVQALHAAVDADANDIWPLPCLFLAMAYQRLGKAQDARGWLDEADRRLKALPSRERAEWEMPEWAERLGLELLRREAGKVVDAAARPDR
jgi:tetratricopeptide (TPR) repeat protein